MPVTYSVNLGSQFEAERKYGILPVIQNLPDNTSKLISPRDVRDAFLTVWASSPIKQTTTINGNEYIGIDSGNPGDRDIKQKIYLGKRNYGGIDIITDDLLRKSEDVDIFIYNTKSDSVSQNQTKMSFLAGTNSTIYANAPYIASEVNSNDTLDFILRNPQINGGSIDIYSDNGNVSINGIKFPKVSDNVNATNGKILRYVGNYPNGYLEWSNSDVAISSLGSAGKVTNIYGGTVSLNGYELEFVNPDLTSIEVGGIPSAFSFSSTSFNGGKWPLSEVIRRLLYPKIGPSISVETNNTITSSPYVELGATSSITFDWDITIFPRNEDDYVSDYIVTKTVGGVTTTTTNYGLSFSGLPGSNFNGSITNMIAASYSSPTFSYYSFEATDVWTPNRYTYANWPSGFSYSGTASIEHVYPVYYGFTSSNITNATTFNNVVKSLDKYVGPYPGASGSISLDYSGTGYFYFIHQRDEFVTPISVVTDPNGFIIHDSNILSNSFFSQNSRNSGFLVSGGKTTNGLLSNWKVWVSGLTSSYESVGNKFTIKF